MDIGSSQNNLKVRTLDVYNISVIAGNCNTVFFPQKQDDEREKARKQELQEGVYSTNNCYQICIWIKQGFFSYHIIIQASEASLVKKHIFCPYMSVFKRVITKSFQQQSHNNESCSKVATKGSDLASSALNFLDNRFNLQLKWEDSLNAKNKKMS